jgi:aryl-phospho-beta-D-glucosidase BglC (GH1 family)
LTALTIALPFSKKIGYYHLCGVESKVIEWTDFGAYQNVFEGAWKYIENAINTAARYNIGVLVGRHTTSRRGDFTESEVDLHATVGAQNPDAHSGTGNGWIRMWDPGNADKTVYALQVLVQQLIKFENVIGLELMNEPQNRAWLPEWYTWALGNLRNISPDIPLYIADAWNSDQYCPWAGLRQDFVVVDQHLYRCFTDADRAKYGDQHAAELKANVLPQFRNLIKQCRGNFIIGEFSAALGGQPPGSDSAEQDRQRRVFAKAQLDIYEETCGGWFFWTLKKAEGWDAGWSLMNATQAEIMPAYVGKRKKAVPDDHQRDNAQKTAYS